jgi:hypothetical protein
MAGASPAIGQRAATPTRNAAPTRRYADLRTV